MADNLIRIAITPPLVDNRLITRLAPGIEALLVEAGWSRVHLRFPEASEKVVEQLIKAIPSPLWPRMSVHDFHALAIKYGCGIHLTNRHPALDVMPDSGITISKSCHSVEEVLSVDANEADYVTISPIFDSISKCGYKSAGFSSNDYRRMQSTGLRLIALGGITPSSVLNLPPDIFAGFATLGSLPWNSTPDNIVEAARQFPI